MIHFSSYKDLAFNYCLCPRDKPFSSDTFFFFSFKCLQLLNNVKLVSKVKYKYKAFVKRKTWRNPKKAWRQNIRGTSDICTRLAGLLKVKYTDVRGGLKLSCCSRHMVVVSTVQTCPTWSISVLTTLYRFCKLSTYVKYKLWCNFVSLWKLQQHNITLWLTFKQVKLFLQGLSL